MSVVTVGTTLHQRRAMLIRKKFADDLQALRDSPAFADLNGSAQQRGIASLSVAARDRLAALRQDEAESRALHRRKIETELFGLAPGGDASVIISFRDAQDRAARIEDRGVATDLLDRASLSGDDILASAVLGRALTAGWTDVVDQYVSQHQDKAPAIQELIDIDAFAGSTQALAAGLGAEFVFNLSPPVEIAGLSMSALEAPESPDPTPTPVETARPDLVAPSGDSGARRTQNPADRFAIGTTAYIGEATG